MEEQKRYYWMVYLDPSRTVYENVTAIHPFSTIEVLNNEDGTGRYLVNWKSIDVEEYNMWKTINNEQ